jgi:(2Fe-2S) ferredoxin
MTNVLLLARSATTAAALRQMERLRDESAGLAGVDKAVFAFTEEGSPSLQAALRELVAAGQPIVIVPMVLPAEPSFAIGVKRALERWQAGGERSWPEIRLAPFLAEQPAMRDLLASALHSEDATVLDLGEPKAMEGSIVPAQKRRVLVCQGAPCIRAGAEMIWGHLRNEQKRLSLRTVGEGTMSARTSCLGPCALAPVLQVWPEGTMYGGVDEAGVDRIIQTHLLGGEVVEDLVYRPTGTKQRLRD